MAIHEIELRCDTCKRLTVHLFEYPGEFEDTAVCSECETPRTISIEVKQQVSPEYFVTLTTAPSLEGYRITRTLEIISAECVAGVDIFADLAAGIRDVIGGRSRGLQRHLRGARQLVLQELRQHAAELSADAVIGVSLDYSQLSGKGTSMLLVVASGTAVRTEPLDDVAGQAPPTPGSGGALAGR